MTEQEIYKVLTEVFQEVFFRDDIELRPELTAADVDSWDSYKQVELLLLTEERLGFKFSSREIDNLTCVGDLVKVILAKGTP